MLLASRDIIGGSIWSAGLTGDIAKQVEKGKSQFKGCEIIGKTLGVIGLGGIGVPVANAAASLGMKVIGYDAYLSVKNALHIFRQSTGGGKTGRYAPGMRFSHSTRSRQRCDQRNDQR